MNIIPITPNPDGSYRQIQSGWPAGTPVPSTHAVWPDELDTTDFYACGGFGSLTVEGQTVTAFTPNEEAYEEWKMEHPETTTTQPTQEERLAALESAMLTMMMGGITDV